MNYVKGILCGFTAIIVAELVPSSWSAFRGISGWKAIGLSALGGELLESLVSPLFWIVAIAIFALFFAVGRLRNKPLRIMLFWIPTVAVCSISVVTAAFLAYLIIYSRKL